MGKSSEVREDSAIGRKNSMKGAVSVLLILSVAGGSMAGAEGYRAAQAKELAEPPVVVQRETGQAVHTVEAVATTATASGTAAVQAAANPVPVSLGQYTITHYCPCSRCSGKYGGMTATGAYAAADHTIAVDPKVIPLGQTIIIDGREYVAEDVGGAIKGKKIDVFVDSHQEALSRGVIRREIFQPAR